MLGDRTVVQEALFCSFSIQNHGPTDHLLRSIDRFVDLDGLRDHLPPYRSEKGRPSIDPELMTRMLNDVSRFFRNDLETEQYRRQLETNGVEMIAGTHPIAAGPLAGLQRGVVTAMNAACSDVTAAGVSRWISTVSGSDMRSGFCA